MNVSKISSDGSRVVAVSHGAFASTEDDPSGFFTQGAAYDLVRSAAAWLTTPITPPATQFVEDNSPQQPAPLVSGDLGSTAWVLTRTTQSVFQHDLYRRLQDGSLQLVGPMIPPGTTEEVQAPSPNGASADLSHLLFSLTTARWPGDTTIGQGNLPSLYELAARSQPEEPKLVGIKNGKPLASNAEAVLVGRCGTVLGGGGSQEQEESHAAVSARGDIVLFTARGGANTENPACEEATTKGEAPLVNELYARVSESTTIAISEPSLSVPGRHCTGTCKEDQETLALRRGAVFQGASEDGSKVFFTTAQPLLDGDTDATGDLYEAEITPAGVQKLVQVSRGDTSDATPGHGARVLSVPAIARDGSRAYLVAEGVLTTVKNKQGLQAAEGVPNLYAIEPASGHTSFITTLPSAEPEGAKVTPDGRFLLFGSAGKLFEYESQTDTLVKVASEGGEGAGEGAAYISSDGAYAVFWSSAALVTGALNDPTHVFHNIYEYHRGQLSLISDGRDVQGEGDRLIGIDASGENVFFETYDRLVSQDTDSQKDIYDARIGGGFPATLTPVGCSGDGCRGPATAPPPQLAAGSATQAGGGNLTPPVSARPIKTPTSVQRLSRALRACRATRNKHRRATCEAHARKRYRSTHAANKARRRFN